MDKQSLMPLIKEWVNLDSEINAFKHEIKHKNKRKLELTNQLTLAMKDKEVDTISIAGGALVRKQRKTKKPITQKMLLSILKQYYGDEDEVASEVATFVIQSRETVVKDVIECKKIS